MIGPEIFDKIKTQRSNSKMYSYAAVLFFALAYLVALGSKQYFKLYGFAYPDFDLAIYYQGSYLLSHLKGQFVTIRGLPLLGDHFQFSHLFTSPFLLIYDSPLTLLWIETLVISISGIVLYRIALHHLRTPPLAALIVFVFFCYPALQYHNLDAYRPNTFAILGVFIVWLGHIEKKMKLIFLGALFVLSAKENMGATLFGLGLYFIFIKRYRLGGSLMATGVISTVIITQVLVPWINDSVQYVHASKLSSLTSFLKGQTPISEYLDKRVFNPENGKYLLNLFLPLGFLPLLRPLLLMCSPILFVNLIVDWPYARMIEYHYSAGFIAQMFICLVLALAFLLDRFQAKKMWVAAFLGALLVTSSLYSYVKKGPDILQLRNIFNEYPIIQRDTLSEIEHINQIIKKDSVSSSYILLPFFANRLEVFMWPNPFKNSYYGTHDNDRYPTDPKYIVIFMGTHTEEHERILAKTGYILVQKFSKLKLYQNPNPMR